LEIIQNKGWEVVKYNIIFATDEGYLQHLAVALKSLLVNNQDLDLNIYTINSGIDKLKYQKLIAVTTGYNCKLTNIEIDDSLFERLVLNHHFTKANYYRLLIAQLINVDKALYLDADIVVNDSIKELYETNICDCYLAAVQEPGFDRHEALKMNKNSDYFNSGVLLINLVYWRKNNLQKRVLSFISENPNAIKFVDQCGLNAIVDGQWKRLPLKFNQQASIFNQLAKGDFLNCFSDSELYEAIHNPTIIHYTGSIKPWHLNSAHPFKSFYWDYLKVTPFKRLLPNDFTFFKLFKWLTPAVVKKFLRNFKFFRGC
jgi:lipopolysaccharide biosynthesis glycosyltransferase